MQDPTPVCEKCDFAAITYATEHWDKLSKEALERFLCAFDDACDWPPDMLETKDGQRLGIALDMLFVLFDQHFDLYLEILETNESINKEYLITLFSAPAVYDLPYDPILKKLREVEGKTKFEEQLTVTFEEAMKAGKK